MKLLVVGNITVDKLYKLDRFPNPGETILAKDTLVNLGGKGLNQAIVASKCSPDVNFLSAVGNKSNNESILNYLKGNRLNYTLIEKEGFTDESIIYSTKEGENIIVSTDSIAKSIMPSETDKLLNQLDSGSIVLLQGNLSVETTSYCIKVAKEKGAAVAINLAPITHKYEEIWDKIDYLIINREESKILTETDDVKEAINYLKKNLIKNVIITLGKEGVIFCDQDMNISHLPVSKVSVKDTTGAGDTFTAVFIIGVTFFNDIKKACKWANKAASITVTRTGTSNAFPDSEELKEIRREVF